ncbi:NUDIX domain-containing protein [Tumidithrix elongata RA019]|uniref:NUDIX domain-containing protein n=1 Tax=Tumidithrix elongata BACA0141 TaxID=2716417 RepID=A0AAW9Q3W2_9CYAN|nr:NUDIX domain-containing protein [Tumidithrix elongata RA019]
MAIDKTIFSTKWVSIKETPRKFYYLERKGKDSVAIFLVRSTKGNGTKGNSAKETPFNQLEVLVRFQPLCIDNPTLDDEMRLHPCPVTGGMEEGENPLKCAVRETLEETGYRLETLLPLGQYITGTQSNEIVYLFWADVTGIEPEVATQDGSVFEAVSRNEWKAIAFLKDCQYSGCLIGYLKLAEILNLS